MVEDLRRIAVLTIMRLVVLAQPLGDCCMPCAWTGACAGRHGQGQEAQRGEGCLVHGCPRQWLGDWYRLPALWPDWDHREARRHL